MLFAYDKDGKRLYAKSGKKYKECYCPVCGEQLTHKTGAIKAYHFAHKSKTACSYDKDSKSEWHIHMQELFPLESLEVRFNDSDTGELKHIADVYLKESNTVIEFQHSKISTEDFFNRTMFHLRAGRKIVWIFDETNNTDNEFGRLKKDDLCVCDRWHQDYAFHWLRSPRKMISSVVNKGELDFYNDFSICVYWGEEDTVHRVISQDYGYQYVNTSVHPIKLSGEMDINEFFYPEEYWLHQDPWKEQVEAYEKWLQEKQAQQKDCERAAINQFLFRPKRPRRGGWL